MPAKEPFLWIAQLDGLRGISIAMVLTAHVYAPGWAQLKGGYGVTVFFVLSGFLITRLLWREERNTGGVSLIAFYVRRAFRLFPVYYLVLAVYCLLILVLGVNPGGRSGFIGALPWYMVYLQEVPYFLDRSQVDNAGGMPFYQSWSLGIEEKFYLVWPILAFWMLRRLSWRIACVVLMALLFSVARLFHSGRFIYPYAAICWGCLFALVYESHEARATLVRWVSSWRVVISLLSWPLLHVASGNPALPAGLGLFAELLYPVAIGFVILSSLQSVPLARLLSWTPLVLLGRFSYCIYLVHLLVRNAVERVLHGLGASLSSGLSVYLLTLLISTALAAVMWYAVEIRLREVGRRIADSLSPKWSSAGH